jgi:hypothetical protein
MDIKPTLTVKNIDGLIKEERKKIVKMNVSTPKKRQEAISHLRSLVWFNLLQGNVIKAFGQMQAIIDLRTMRNPDSGCTFLAGRTPNFLYLSNQDKALLEMEKHFDETAEVADG